MANEEVSVEEFLRVNTAILAIGPEIHELESKLRELNKTSPNVEAEIRAAEEELSRVESAREHARLLHEQALAPIQEELLKLRQDLESEAKREQDRIAELTIQISTMNQKIIDDDQRIENLREKLTADDTVIQRKAAKFYAFLIREQPFRPYVDFLRVSRSMPMFLEDIGSSIASLRVSKTRVDASIRDLTAQVDDLRRTHKNIKGQIRSKHQDLKAIHTQAAAAKERFVNAGKEIESTQKTVNDANQRLEAAKDQTRELISERQSLEEQLAVLRKSFEDQVSEVERSKAEIEAQLNQIQSSKDEELNACNDRIQAIRKRLTHIKEKDDDPEVPRVDIDLRRQIERIREEKVGIVRQTERIVEETKRLEIQQQQKTWDLQTLTLRTQPTQALLGLSEFQEKFVLLKELVLQNMGLREEVTRMTGRIEVLRQENDEIRKRLEGQDS
jgi:chromosome segregation ATPase